MATEPQLASPADERARIVGPAANCAFSLLAGLQVDFPELELFQRRLAAGDAEACAAMSGLVRACVHVIEAGTERVMH